MTAKQYRFIIFISEIIFSSPPLFHKDYQMVRIYLDPRILQHPAFQKSGSGQSENSIFGNIVSFDGLGSFVISINNPRVTIHNEEELTPLFTHSNLVLPLSDKIPRQLGSYRHKSAFCRLYLNYYRYQLDGSAKDFPDLRHLYQLIEAGTIEPTCD